MSDEFEQTSISNAVGIAWNVLLPMCDGDVLNLEGVRVLERVMAYTSNNAGIPADSPATQKSTYSGPMLYFR